MSNRICFRMFVVATDHNLDAQLDRLSGLAESQRRTLYAFVAGSTRPVSRDEAATAVGISRPLAAYHLDRLVQDGLLEVRFERRSGRSGPGAGRPSKLYQRSTQPLELTIPTRDYAFIADLLARAIERDTSDQAQTALWKIARDSGAASAAQARGGSPNVETSGLADLRRMLADRGYEPYEDEEGDLRLRNCPFHRLAVQHRELVCAANLAFITGIAQQAAAEEPVHVRLDPRPGECCVAIARQPQ
jgi:predicted ArsR family transcriptional regulator